MQNKGAIKILAILLAVVSLYQLTFTWVANNVRSDAEAYSGGDPVKEKIYLDSVANVKVYPLLGYTYQECQQKEINLGLDLKGGMNVTLEISVVDVVKALSNYSKNPTFVEAIKLAKEKQKDSQKDFVDLFGESFKEVDPNARLASVFNTPDLKELINAKSTDEEVLKVLKDQTQAAIDNSFQILRTRIDRFGVAQPNIQRLETAGRILVELPGIKDPERVRKLLQGTAQLEFWETYNLNEIYGALWSANNVIRDLNNAESETKEEKDTTKVEIIAAPVEAETELVADSTTQTNNAESLLAEVTDSTAGSVDTTAAIEAQRKNMPLWTVLSPSIDQKGNPMQTAGVGVAHFKDTAKVNEYLHMKQAKAVLPKDLKFLWGVKPIKGREDLYELYAIKITTRDGRAPLEGDVITNARQEFGQNQAAAEVSMTMNSTGAREWARITKANIDRQVAIVLDNYVYSAPNVNDEIKGGRSSITGGFSIEEATDLANILKSGKLPAPAHIIEEAIVGPSLGQEAINSGLLSFVIAFILVLIYMFFFYSRSGIVADLALIANIFFIMGVLASLGAVLTLPGIAGIVLTIGMSVDANVLIFERIKEEIAAGKGLKLAVTDGYKNAYSAIIDANVTTLLTGIILFVFGTGPIKGFATTLIIGILTSLFAAIFITRIIFVSLLDKNKTIKFAIKMTENVLKNAQVKFIEKRKMFYVISSIIIIAGIVSLFTRGLDYGIDFVGGRTYVVRFHEPVVTSDLAKSLKDVMVTDAPEVKVFGESNQVKISTKYLIDSEDENADDMVEEKIFEGLKSYLGDGVTYQDFTENFKMSSQKVGPTIADDIKVSAVWAILFSLLGIFIYIVIRFRNWQFGLGALAALAHDVLIVIGLFSIFYGILPFSLSIDQAFIAAILTVVGYSINDTVVVLDRIREFVGLHPKSDRKELYNSALNSTLTRTLSTSLSTFVVLLAIFIFGGEVIRGFIFALLVGIIVGTYSSLFIATPVAYDTIKKPKK
ncbi:MAG: protein translocase subunit SecDF [Bacteroidales bacterium]|nr:protein translocase subunit SecDF [Bacteroidales bacterium]